MNGESVFVLFWVLLAILSVSSCASNHDLDSDNINYLGGGLDVFETEKLTYKIIAKTNFAPFENFSTARNMWAAAAYKACNGSAYREKDTEEYSYKSGPDLIFIPYLISVKTGFVVCSK